MRKKKDNYWLHGGSETPQYFCKKCGHAHSKHSMIGKAHWKHWLEGNRR